MYFSPLSINKTSWQLKQACDLINSVIRLTEMMSCMTMITLCCIGINESEDPQTGKKEEWDADDVIGEMKWEDFGSGVNGRALINVCRISQESSRCWVHLFMIMMTLIFHMFSLSSLLWAPSSSAIVWRKLLYQHRSADQMLAGFFYSLQKKKDEEETDS